MSSPLARLGRACFRRRGLVCALWGAVLAAVVGLVVTVGGQFDDEFTIPGSESQEALDRLGELAPAAGSAGAQLVLVAPEGAAVSDPRHARAVQAAVASAAEVPQVAAVADPFVSRSVSRDGRAALAGRPGGCRGRWTGSCRTSTSKVRGSAPRPPRRPGGSSPRRSAEVLGATRQDRGVTGVESPAGPPPAPWPHGEGRPSTAAAAGPVGVLSRGRGPCRSTSRRPPRG